MRSAWPWRFSMRAKAMLVPQMCVLLLALACCDLSAAAQLPVSAGQPTATAALISDPHLDPFRDPAKVKRLADTTVGSWPAILAEPASPDAAQRYAALQAACHERLSDADASLELSAFDAVAADKPAFVLVGGDMLVHGFNCRYQKLLDPAGTDTKGLAEFAAKTVEFQLAELRRRLPNTPIHLALGNNDSDCEDYALDETSPFLRRLAEAVAQGWIVADERQRKTAEEDFFRFGSYALPLPVAHIRLIVLEDLYLSSDYRGTCGKVQNRASATALMAWLTAQLADAQRAREPVWVLAHIPPEVNIYRTYLTPHDICHGEAPAMFFPSGALNNLLVQYRDIVRVFISGHTHVDEMHLLESSAGPGNVPLKTIPSISPISTNPPAFLLAAVDTKSGTMLDYTLQQATGTGDNLRWITAYDFDEKYREPAFTAEALRDLMQRWQGSPDAFSAEIANYQEHVASGLRLLAFRATWPQQLCAMEHSSAAAFSACACAASGGMLPSTKAAPNADQVAK